MGYIQCIYNIYIYALTHLAAGFIKSFFSTRDMGCSSQYASIFCRLKPATEEGVQWFQQSRLAQGLIVQWFSRQQSADFRLLSVGAWPLPGERSHPGAARAVRSERLERAVGGRAAPQLVEGPRKVDTMWLAVCRVWMRKNGMQPTNKGNHRYTGIYWEVTGWWCQTFFNIVMEKQ